MRWSAALLPLLFIGSILPVEPELGPDMDGLGGAAGASGAVDATSHDVILRGGTIVDGTGAPRFIADLALDGDRIAAIGDLSGATAPLDIDATGLVVTPGFFDMGMGANLLNNIDLATAENMLMQGVTTGLIAWEAGAVDKQQERADLEQFGLAVNVMSFFPVISAWQQVLGETGSDPTEDQLREMYDLASQAMEDGAFGVGAAIEYCPLCLAETEDIIEVVKAAAPYNGFYASHIRNEANGVINATAELIEIARGAGVPGHVGHMKVAGHQNCGNAEITTGLVEAAQAEGLDIDGSQYPYTAGQTFDIGYLIPDWAEEGTEIDIQLRFRDPAIRPDIVQGIRERIEEVTGTADRVEFSTTGMTLQEESDLLGQDPAERVLQIRENEQIRLTTIHFGCDEDLKTIMTSPWISIQSDMGAWVPAHDATVFHPRGYGTYARVLGAYGRDAQWFDLEEAVRKMTGQPAYRTGLAYDQRGLLQEGWAADVVVFDPQAIIDTATYEDAGNFPEGIEHVFVNGRQMVADGELTPLHERLLDPPGRYLIHRADMPSTPQPGYDFRVLDHGDEQRSTIGPWLAMAALATALFATRRRP